MKKYEKYGYIKAKCDKFYTKKGMILKLRDDSSIDRIRYNVKNRGSYFRSDEEKRLFIFVTEKYALKHGYIDNNGDKVEGVK